MHPHPDLNVPADPRGSFQGNNDFTVVASIDNGFGFDVQSGTASVLPANAVDCDCD